MPPVSGSAAIAIHALPGHAQDEVLIAGSGPWNNELKYQGNPNGDWITYFTDVLSLLEASLTAMPCTPTRMATM